MNQIEIFLLLIGIPLSLLLAGYWLASFFDRNDGPTRLSVALLAGIASLLLTVSLVNYFSPISGLAAWLCFLPIAVTLLFRQSRSSLYVDLRDLVFNKTAWAYGSIVILFLVILLWPALSSLTTVMYDGTSNHDSFFWVVVAEHLKRHTYMERPVWDALQPLASVADAVVGWNPAWGRMGSEGLLALCSAVVGLSPLKLYIYVTVCLFIPWLAAVHLAIRAFYAERLSWLAQGAVLGLHPIFIFFYINANLPNLLGVIEGSTAIVATVLAVRAGWEHRNELLAWSGLLALSLHGLYCTYPEMIPFVFLPCGLLWLRAWFTLGSLARWKSQLIVAGAVVASLCLNPASTFRAGWGFYASFLSARTEDRWGNIMAVLHPLQYIPALGTLAPYSTKWLGVGVGLLLSLLIIMGVSLAWRRAHDLIGALLAFSGGGVLLLYTLLGHFPYGWQKSVQFCGIFVAAALSGAVIDALYQHRSRMRVFSGFARIGSVLLLAFLAFAVVIQCQELYKWSERKLISQDWFTLRDQSRSTLRALPVLVEAATFRMAFYHGMWAAYFLPDSNIYYASRGEQGGGYLRANVTNEASESIPTPAAVLVSRAWAESIDANSPRILTGKEYVLLQTSNRVFKMNGVYPLNGTPDAASALIELEMLPHSDGVLRVELQPRKPKDWPTGTWQVIRRIEGGDDFLMNVSGASPWVIKVPLLAGKRNKITLSITSGKSADDPLPFAIKDLRVEAQTP